MPVVTQNVVVGAGTLYVGPSGTARPADTVAEGTEWASPWVHVGGTEEGVTFTYDQEVVWIRIEEQSTPVKGIKSITNVRLQAGLSEETMENLQRAIGGVLTTIAAGVGQPGVKNLALSETLDVYAVGFQALNKDAFWHRIHFPQGVQSGDVTMAFRRAQNNRATPVNFQAICPVPDISIRTKTAVATG